SQPLELICEKAIATCNRPLGAGSKPCGGSWSVWPRAFCCKVVQVYTILVRKSRPTR
ncbi:unnamed protein product, partial [Tetraodon nigroviridis]